ncbi:hypothetical protein BV25DRAFT_1966810 [Artomyces pyxidatus]|uniref:Uncharacterized protein n=1 Tax=Artomyces pyxidatus TaxID=48021 RepID=A0ACB8TEY2_9AGAM|nr:hypothetical protein BV25DRAFT_1966810 [Artomyces pyxidatus]
MSDSETQLAVQWYPPSFDVRVEAVPMPKVEHPDDAIVKIQLAGLCGSDLHGYRGHEGISDPHTCGHEFVGHVVALGSSFHSGSPASRPELYRTLKLNDKVVSPFSVSCGECRFCRIGFTARCASSLLFGTSALPGAQAQFVRVPHAGGTLVVLPPDSPLSELPDPALLLLADILPTGIFVATQAITHPKVMPLLTGVTWPGPARAFYGNAIDIQDAPAPLTAEDRTLEIAIVGLGPVGMCATVALLDMLANAQAHFNIVAIDPNAARRASLQAVYDALPENARRTSHGTFQIADIDEGKEIVRTRGRGGCHAVLEIVGNPSALTLALSLLAPAGVISSCGVHQGPPLPFIGREMYGKNVSLEFGRCSVRTLFGPAAGLLLRRRDVLAEVVKVVPLADAAHSYARFERGEGGKVAFDPWA